MRKQRGSTSPSKVYAKRERTADFLLGEESVTLDPEASKVRSELLGRLEYDAGHAQTSSSVSIGGDIVNINRLLSSNLAGFEGFAVDERVRLAGIDTVRVDTDGEETEEGEAGFLVRHVDGIGVRK